MVEPLIRRSATTIGELDIHLGYFMETLQQLSARQAQLATKSDVADMRLEMRTFATKSELRSLKEEITNGDVPHTLKSWSDIAMRVAGTLAALASIWWFLHGGFK